MNRLMLIISERRDMKEVVDIENRIKEIEADSRYQSGLKKPATVVENAPLALVQLSLETELKALKWVLSEV